MTKPTPNLKTVEGALERMVRLAPKIAEAATWAWPMCYERRRGESNGASGGDVNRPTEATVGYDRYTERAWDPEAGAMVERMVLPSREWDIRVNVGAAGTNVMHAAALLEAAMGALDKAAKAAGRGDGPMTDTPMAGPRMVSKAEVKKAMQMQRWRNDERKKGVGRGTY